MLWRTARAYCTVLCTAATHVSTGTARQAEVNKSTWRAGEYATTRLLTQSSEILSLEKDVHLSGGGDGGGVRGEGRLVFLSILIRYTRSLQTHSLKSKSLDSLSLFLPSLCQD